MSEALGQAIVIFDIDDTLSDTDHRQGVLEMPMKDIPKHMSRFDCMESLCAFDPPIIAMVAKCVEHIKNGDDVRFWSGRGERQRLATIRWLSNYLQQPQDHFTEVRLRMRPVADYRASHVLKFDFLRQLQPGEADRIAMFYDDNEDNIKMWNQMGFKAKTTLVKK